MSLGAEEKEEELLREKKCFKEDIKSFLSISSSSRRNGKRRNGDMNLEPRYAKMILLYERLFEAGETCDN